MADVRELDGAGEWGTRIVGREPELSELHEFLDAGRFPSTLVLTGGPGIGKTTLWEAGISAARKRGLRVLSARSSGAEARLSFGALIDLFDEVDTEALAGLPAPQLRALEVALLRAEPLDQPPERDAIAVGVLSALRALATHEPLLVAVDDVQWLDPPSGHALAFAARRLERHRVAFLLAKRSGRSSALEQAFERGEALREVEVGPLSLGATRRLLAERLDLILPRQHLRRIVESTLGNPLFVLELGRMLAEHGVQLGEDMPVPDSVAELLGTRVARLAAPAHKVLLALALSGELRMSELAAIADPVAVADAVDAGVVVVDGERVRVSHPLLAAVVKERSRPRDRRELHLELARSALGQESHALHLALATELPDEELAAAIAAAAAAAVARGAAEQAVVLAEHALRLTPTGSPEHAERLLALAEGLLETADDERAVELLSPQLDALPTGSARARAHLLLAESSATLSEHENERLVDRALEESQDDPALHATVLARKSLHLAAGLVRRLGDAEALALEALPAARMAGVEVEHEVLFSLVSIRAMRGRAVDDLIVSFEGDDHRDLFRSLQRAALIRLGWRGDVRRARAGLQELLSLADERGQASAYVVVRLNLIGVELRAGEWDAADALLDEWAQSAGGEILTGPAYEHLRALGAAGRGRAEDAARWSDSAIALGEARGNQWHVLGALRVRGIAALLAHDPERAVESLQRAWEHTQREGVDDPGVFPVAPDLVEALLELGRIDEARAVAERLRELAEQQEHPWGLATARRCSGLVRLASESYEEEAAAALVQAAADYSERGLRFDEARSLLGLGRAQRRLKRWGAARRSLEQAAAVFDVLGSPGWADETRSELARVGARRPTAAGALTPAERRVAELAAEGLSNKEIARALFVAVNTVEAHLSHAYVKLGIRSRSQLAGRLSPDA